MSQDKFNFTEIESKWSRVWEEKEVYKTKEDQTKPKYYILDMFPYPSGVGLHVGHPGGYVATDIFGRAKAMQGYNVLHPMGWDAFGLPAENYALKNKLHPRIATEQNVENYKRQLKMFGFTYDWSREINTTDPGFYKWTQWAFLEMFKRGLAYESFEPIIWCPSCKTGLAMEDLEDGKCERCGSEVERKPMRQWVIRITDYADRMLEDLDKLPEWEESIKIMQKHWIGRSEGAEVKFKIQNSKVKSESQNLKVSDAGYLTVFTTRPDTLFGCTYMVVAPEHHIISDLKFNIENFEEVQAYVEQAKKKSDLERAELQKDKTGVELKGLKAINPVNNEEIPVFVADYVLISYGTGAIMAVPAHDSRDFEFAQKFNLPINEVVACEDQDSNQNVKSKNEAYCGDGISMNSVFLNGLKTSVAKTKMIAWLAENGLGKKSVNYKLNDWVFSRQRYWGEPIPVVHCEHCQNLIKEHLKNNGDLQEKISNFEFRISNIDSKFKIKNYEFRLGELMSPGWIADERLPITLPEVESYEPTGTGESPLAAISDWVDTTCPRCGGPAKRETNTMPQWAGSSWYYLRYIDPTNNDALVDKNKEKYWSPVDFYVGGAEHATRHLIYARFWHKFLYDIGAVNYDEPFTRLQHVGLIAGEDGRKMSKRWGNVVNPDDVIREHGADAFRVYVMFMGPFDQGVAWSTNGVKGAGRFLDKVWESKNKIEAEKQGNLETGKLEKMLHKTIKKVTEDINGFKYNTAIAQMMVLANEMAKTESLTKEHYEMFLKILAPFAPFVTEEIWEQLGNEFSIHQSAWPQHDPDLIIDDVITMSVQVNGKFRGTIEVALDAGEEAVIEQLKPTEIWEKHLNGGYKKIILVKNKIVNFIV